MTRYSPLALTATAILAFAIAPVPAHAQFGQQRDAGELLLKADANGDGEITSAEFSAARAKLFDRVDRNNDGVLNSADKSGGRMLRRSGGERIQQLIDSMDHNHDGQVDRSEFVNGRSAVFEFADADSNGRIDRRELAEFREAAAERKASR